MTLPGFQEGLNQTGTGAESNAYGFYSLTLPEGRYTIKVQYIGFQTKTDSIVLDRNRVLNLQLTPEAINIGEVVVVGEWTNTNVTSTETSTNKLEIEQVKSIPVLLGEKDILKTIQLLPGVQSAGEGSTGFYARGGGTDQNLIVLDEAPVYNSAHLLGFLSVFNSDAIKDVKLITGGIGLLASRLTLEGPIVKDEGELYTRRKRPGVPLRLFRQG